VKPAPIPPDEDERLAALLEYGILDTEPEEDYDEIVRLAAHVCNVPIAGISLLDAERQWFKASVGLDLRETCRDVSFCAHAVLGDDLFVVEDAAADDRFRDNPLVIDAPRIRFYAGAPLVTPEGKHVGVLCVVDTQPRKLERDQIQALRWLSRQVVTLLELRRKSAAARKAAEEREKAESALRDTASFARPPRPIDTGDRWRSWPVILTLVTGIVATLLAIRVTHTIASRGDEERFAQSAQILDETFADRVKSDARLFESCTALWSLPDAPTYAAWQRFIAAQPVSRIPGLYGIGFVELVPRARVGAFVARGKQESGEWFTATANPVRDDAYLLRWFSPSTASRSIVGADFAEEPVRRATIEAARDQGRTIITPRVMLKGINRDGFLLFTPIFRQGMPRATVAERRAALIGWLYISVSASEFLHQLPIESGTRVSLYDGDVADAHLLYASPAPAGDAVFRSRRDLQLLGRTWTVVVDGTRQPGVERRETQIVSGAGAIVTLLLVAVVVGLNSTRRRALRIAAERTIVLRDSESRLRSILEHIADAVIAFPKSGALVAFNPAAERLFGYQPSEIVGRDVSAILPAIHAAPADGTTTQTMARRSDDSEVPVELAVKPVPGDKRQLTVAILRDISGRLANEERLRASEERYRDLFENSNDLIHSVDGEGRFVFANRAWFRTLRYDESQLRTMTMADILDPEAIPAQTNGRKRSDMAMPLPWCTRAASATLPCSDCLDCEGVETIFRTQDGRRVHVEGNISCKFDEEGRPISTRGIWRDITARKRAEQELRASQERLGAMIELADDIMYRADERGRFTFVNATASRLTGYEKQELIGMQYLNLIRPDYRDAVKEFYQLQFADKVATSYLEFPIITSDGIEMWLGQKVQPVLEHGEIVGYHGLARDVTDRKRLKDELVLARDAALESAQLKSRFLATMSHEIRTPMNGVLGMIGVLLETDLTAEQREIANTVQTSADLLLTILNDILDYSKIESGKLTFERNEFDLVEVVDGSVDLLVEQARNKSLNLAVIIESDVPTKLRGDAGRMRQVLINLIGNAVKFTEKGGVVIRVTVDIETENTVGLRVTISDSGIGIDRDAVGRLFEPFVQADGSTTRKFGGTGLGLAICKQLVEQMNGRIGVESEPGRGSTFWFTAEMEKQSTARRDLLPLGHAVRVLIVDDQEVNRRVFAQQVAALGVQSDVASNAVEALELLRRAREQRNEYRACIVDLQMPENDAIQLAVAERAEGFDVPLILVTSLGRRREDLDAYHTAGFERVLMKPVR